MSHKNNIIRLLVLIPSTVLFIAASSKIISFRVSVESVSSSLLLFSINNNFISIFLTFFLIAIELFAAAILVIKKDALYPILFSAFLYLIFIFFNIYKIIQSGDSNCGCFGEIFSVNASAILIIDIINLALLLLILKLKEVDFYAKAV